MYATYMCELCFKTYDSDGDFKNCKGDACHEICCGECMKKCKNPTCKNYVCAECLRRYASYSGEYCIDCAMWDENEEGESINFDFVAQGMTHDAGYKYLGELQEKRKLAEKGTRNEQET